MSAGRGFLPFSVPSRWHLQYTQLPIQCEVGAVSQGNRAWWWQLTSLCLRREWVELYLHYIGVSWNFSRHTTGVRILTWLIKTHNRSFLNMFLIRSVKERLNLCNKTTNAHVQNMYHVLGDISSKFQSSRCELIAKNWYPVNTSQCYCSRWP